MAATRPKYSKEEFARRGDEIYERDILPQLSASDKGKYVVIDIETGDFEMDDDQLIASDQLRKRHPNAQAWLRRVGYRYICRFGARRLSESP